MKELVNTTEKMTSLVIAEITGKKHNDVMKAVRKMEGAWIGLGQGKFSLISYIDSQNRAKPMYELSKTECLYIATKFNDEARGKLVLRWQDLEEKQTHSFSPAEQLLQNAQLLVEQEKKITEHENRLKVLEAKNKTKPDYFTIAGYGSLNGVKVNVKLASKLGRSASRICKEENFKTDSIPDPRFGVVKMYPIQVLDRVFEEVSV